MPRVHLATIGNAAEPVAYSGTPFHCLLAMRSAGFDAHGLDLDADRRCGRLVRIAWNAASIVRGERFGGFQYSRRFLERIWSGAAPIRVGDHILNFFPLYPPSVLRRRGVQRWFFIDQTLTQLYETYDVGERIGARTRARALGLERDGYLAARGVVVNSRWARESVIDDYGIRASKVFVVPQGANIPDALYRRWEARRAGGGHLPYDRGRPLRLVFVGKHAYRKGLDRLLAALARLGAGGLPVRLKVIGCSPRDVPRELASLPDVEWLGFIDKTADGDRYLAELEECDLGCWLSRAEAGGVALREYHAAGLGVIAPDVGGAPEHTLPGATVLVSADADPDSIARRIDDLARNPGRVNRMKETSWNHRNDVLWGASVRSLASILDRDLAPA